MTVTKANKLTSQLQSLDYYLKLTYPITFLLSSATGKSEMH